MGRPRKKIKTPALNEVYPLDSRYKQFFLIRELKLREKDLHVPTNILTIPIPTGGIVLIIDKVKKFRKKVFLNILLTTQAGSATGWIEESLLSNRIIGDINYCFE